MHELSIATSLVSLAADAAENAGGAPIQAVCIQVGDAAGVVIEALEFAWEVAREQTPCADARLEIERIPLTARCDSCDADVELPCPPVFRCPACGEPTPTVLTGRELDLVALVLADNDTPSDREGQPHATAHP